MHEPIERKLNHPADFRVTYRFYSAEEGGRKLIPFQGYRSDFWYDDPMQPNPGAPIRRVFMIHPEFEDENGEVVSDNSIPVSQSGTARMWIVDSHMREHHCARIHVGTTGNFMEGPRKVAECTVIEIIGLLSNPK